VSIISQKYVKVVSFICVKVYFYIFSLLVSYGPVSFYVYLNSKFFFCPKHWSSLWSFVSRRHKSHPASQYMPGRDQKWEVILVGEGQHCERFTAAQWSESVSSVHQGPHTSLCGDVSQDWNDADTQQVNLRGQNWLPVLSYSLAILLFWFHKRTERQQYFVRYHHPVLFTKSVMQ